MRYSIITPLITILILVSVNICYSDNIEIVYTSPIDGAKYLRPEETIIISANKPINESTISTSGIIDVSGRLKNNYTGTTFLSSDGKTIIFKPSSYFMWSDTVTVNINNGIKTTDGENLNPKSITFIIRDNPDQIRPFNSFQSEFEGKTYRPLFYQNNLDDPLPADFPRISIVNNFNPSYGRLFFTNFNMANFNGGNNHEESIQYPQEDYITITPNPYLIIFENSGDVYYYKRIEPYATDFKKISADRFVYNNVKTSNYYMFDTDLNFIDSFYCGNGYETDQHDLQFLDNGHFVLMSYDPVIIDMSKIVQGGDTNCSVLGLVIQELDNNKNVIFQWRSWDHLEITEATHENMTAPKLDYVHGNSLEYDYDGNLICSFRHTDQIIKINRVTGDIMWRLGGKKNQFTFINDPIGFSHQHDARRIAPGRITLFDNGNFHSPPYSRAIEYELDEVNKTATLVWQFDHNKEVFAFAMGNTQRLPNGNTVIGWGAAGYPNITEVDPQGNILFEMANQDSLWCYRAFRFTFDQPENPIPETYNLGQNYPNPFNPTTTISFNIPLQSNVKLYVYDILGREVAKLVNQELNPGNYNILWNAQNLSSGVYFYKLIASGFVETKKMVLLK